MISIQKVYHCIRLGACNNNSVAAKIQPNRFGRASDTTVAAEIDEQLCCGGNLTRIGSDVRPTHEQLCCRGNLTRIGSDVRPTHGQLSCRENSTRIRSNVRPIPEQLACRESPTRNNMFQTNNNCFRKLM